MLTAVALRERGFEVVEVTSGEAGARSAATPVAPDMVVLDALMPGHGRLPDLPRPARAPRLRADSGADADRAGRRRLDHPRLRAGATDFFVKSTQWSLLAGRLRYLLRASRTRIELERSKAKLARAQDLARMGSFDWRRGARRASSGCRPRRCACSACTPTSARRACARCCAWSGTAQRARPDAHAARSRCATAPVLATDVSVTLRDGRQRIVHVEAEPEFEHGHGVGYTGVVQDVTDRRVAEDRIRHLAQLRRPDRPAQPPPADLAHRARARAGAPAAATVRRCCWSTSTASRSSTTRSATPPATSC